MPHHLDTGYRIVENVLAVQECDALLEALSHCNQVRPQAGVRHLMARPEIAAVASDNRLLGLAQETLNGLAVPYKATLFDKNEMVNWSVIWHQDIALPLVAKNDSPEWSHWTTKAEVHYAQAPTWALERIVALRIHLDASLLENGPLRVIPNSHKRGVLTAQEIEQMVASEEPEICEVGRGGVLVMHPLLIHSSTKSRSHLLRRVLHIEYADTLELAPGIHLALS